MAPGRRTSPASIQSKCSAPQGSLQRTSTSLRVHASARAGSSPGRRDPDEVGADRQHQGVQRETERTGGHAVQREQRGRQQPADQPDEQFDAQDFGGEPRGEAPVMRVSVMPSFGASPLVNADTGEHVSPAWLDIDYELAKRIERWDDTWQATFNAEDPGSSGFDDEVARKAYDDEGRAIVALLRAQWQGELVEVADQFR